MRVAVVVAAMLFCAPVFAQGVKLPSVTNSIGMKLIEIPAGKFTMGSPEDEKGRYGDEDQVSVTLTQSFGLGKTEVTQGQWKSVMGTEPWKGKNFINADKDCPATYVSWDDATEFCKKLATIERKAGNLQANEEYRLPTEAEWEYACRAGTTTAFAFGDDESRLDDFAWFDGNAFNGGEKYAHKVGLKKPNPWGLYDMHGNVWEWCSDWYEGKLSGDTDPAGPNGGSHRVFRGGSWWYLPGLCRSASRNGVQSHRLDYLGFRVARSQQGAQTKPAPPVVVVTRPGMEKPKPVGRVYRPVSKPGQTITNSIGMVLIGIPAGTFAMGDERIGVSVTLTQEFLLGKTEVTQGQWKNVMRSEPWNQSGEGEQYVKADKDCPATYVSWNDATEFCKKLTTIERKAGNLQANEEYRLPTEAEWEYACRAGTTTAYSFGDDESKLGEYAWFNGNTLKVNEPYAHRVGLKKPNPWGLHDMHGNVLEWCSDWYGKEPSGGVDPVGPKGGSLRVGRSGCWGRDPNECLSAYSIPMPPSSRNVALGFRAARSQSAQ